MSHEVASHPRVEETIDLVNSDEFENNSRVVEFHAFIAQNSEVLVESSRAPGYKAPLGLLMSMCPEEVTAQNVDEFFAEAQSMIANSALETEEETVEAETEEETVEKEDKTEQKQEAKKAEQKPDSVEQEKDIVSEQEVQKTEKPQTTMPQKQEVAKDNFITAKAEATKDILAADSDLSQSSEIVNASEKTASSSSAASARRLQPAESSSHAVETLAVSGSVNPTESKSLDPVSPVAEEEPIAPTGSIQNNPQPIEVKQKALESVEISVVAVPETEENNIIYVENLQTEEIFQTPGLIIEENYATIKAEDTVAVEEEIEPYLPVQTDEQWQLADDFAEYSLPEEWPSKNFNHPVQETLAFNMSEYTQDSPEPIVELSLPAEEVEQTIIQMADKIEDMEAETAESAHQLLDAIADKIAQSQARVESNPENLKTASETEDMEQELKELFIQLFDQVEIEYSKELIESCVKLAQLGDMSELISSIDTDQAADFPQDKGTHEIIKQLLAVLNNFKKSVIHACEIGKSALQLCSQQTIVAR